jgi:hypothetical protein
MYTNRIIREASGRDPIATAVRSLFSLRDRRSATAPIQYLHDSPAPFRTLLPSQVLDLTFFNLRNSDNRNIHQKSVGSFAPVPTRCAVKRPISNPLISRVCTPLHVNQNFFYIPFCFLHVSIGSGASHNSDPALRSVSDFVPASLCLRAFVCNLPSSFHQKAPPFRIFRHLSSVNISRNQSSDARNSRVLRHSRPFLVPSENTHNHSKARVVPRCTGKPKDFLRPSLGPLPNRRSCRRSRP